MNNKGFAKTLEAVIAVIIVLTFIFYLTPQQKPEESMTPEKIKEVQSFILQSMSTNETMRDCALQATAEGDCAVLCGDINSFIQQHKPQDYSFQCEICKTASTCSANLPLDVSLYTDSVFLSGKNANKVVRLYFWKQQ